MFCLNARHAKTTLALQLNKPDGNDARRLAQIVWTGWHGEVAVKSLDSHIVRSLLTSRAQLVRMRVDLANQTRGVLKPFELVAGKDGGRPFAERVRAVAAEGPLRDMAEALLAAWDGISEQIAALGRRLVAIARRGQAVRQLMTALCPTDMVGRYLGYALAVMRHAASGRGHHACSVARDGRRAWERATGYRRPNEAEWSFSRPRRVLGSGLRSREMEAHQVEARTAVVALNRMAERGMPRADHVV